MKFFINDFFIKCFLRIWSFTEEIFNGKFHFLCSAILFVVFIIRLFFILSHSSSSGCFCLLSLSFSIVILFCFLLFFSAFTFSCLFLLRFYFYFLSVQSFSVISFSSIFLLYFFSPFSFSCHLCPSSFYFSHLSFSFLSPVIYLLRVG